jgi:glutamyl-tRNA reductase
VKVGVMGINYKSSDLSLREVIAKACERCLGSESAAAAKLNIVLLSTCNRTEIYFSDEDLAQAHSELLSLLREEVQVAFEHKIYSYFGIDCFAHLAKVAAGLDSQIVAETEIQRQVKGAYLNASLHRQLPSAIHFLFQKSLKISKSLRSNYPHLQTRVSLEDTLFNLSSLMLEEIQRRRIFFVGNSEINRKIIHHFKRKGAGEMSLCTRAPAMASELDSSVKVCDWSHLTSWSEYDIVICGTSQHHTLLSEEQLSPDKALSSRLIFDLSVPRNVDPKLGRHPQIALLNIEELGKLILKRQRDHVREFKNWEEKIQSAASFQLALFHEKESRTLAYA